MMDLRKHKRATFLAIGASCLSMALAGCSANGASPSTQTKGVTITVALASAAPPKAALDAFTKDTGITVKWSNIDWDSLQTKITAAATAKTYFADATDVDWSRVGQLGGLDWFYPMEDYVDTKALAADMPQLNTFMAGDHAVGIPYDASFMTTTVNKDMFEKAGITTMPTTMAQYTEALKTIKAKGVAEHPLNIPFAAAEGLSTYWYQATAAFGGTVLDGSGEPQFTSEDSAGYKAMQWMVDALKDGLVPAGSINTTDSEGSQTLMAKGTVATTFSDYSGKVGSTYNVPEMSSVVDQIVYIPTPGLDGVGPNLDNPDGIGIPRQAKHPEAAAKFIEWFTSAQSQLDFVGANGPEKAIADFAMPSRLTAVKELTENGKLLGGTELTDMLENSTQPVFPDGAPTWYPAFSRAVSTSLHAAATGSISVADAISAIADATKKLANGS